MFCYFIDIRALSYYENDVHIVNLPNGNSIYYVLWYHIKHWDSDSLLVFEEGHPHPKNHIKHLN